MTERLDTIPTAHTCVLEYFELRALGNNHLAACARLGITERTMADRWAYCNRAGLPVPPKPDGRAFADDWPHFQMPKGYR